MRSTLSRPSDGVSEIPVRGWLSDVAEVELVDPGHGLRASMARSHPRIEVWGSAKKVSARASNSSGGTNPVALRSFHRSLAVPRLRECASRSRPDAGEVGGESLLEVSVDLGVEQGAGADLGGVRPDGRSAVMVGFGEVPGEHVGVEGGVAVAEDLVVDAEGVGAGVEGVADAGHVGQVLGPAGVVEVGEVVDHRVGEQEAVASEELVVAEHGPSRRHPTDHSGVRTAAGGVDSFVDEGGVACHLVSAGGVSSSDRSLLGGW